jgi:hypothetical protein
LNAAIRFIAGLVLLIGSLPALSPSAFAQRTPAFQDGVLVPGDALKAITQGRYGAAGGIAGDAFGRGLNPFSVTSSGLGFCVNDAVTTGPYNSLCIGYEDGAAVISLNGYGGAATTFSLMINGTPIDLNYSGQILDFDNAGATTTTEITLPGASPIAPTRCYTVVETFLLKLTAPVGNTIALGTGTGTSGSSIESDSPHSSVCLHARVGGEWIARSVTGEWIVN